MLQNQTELLTAYRRMRTIREFEERMHIEFAKGGVPGFVHLYAGQEAAAVGICANLDENDYFHITHRAHGPAIARGADLFRIACEIYCRRDGLCRGRGGSAHLHDVNIKLIGANSGVGSGAALACGSALAIRHRGESGVAVALMGDGAINQGIVSESFNLAVIWKLPVIFAFENNGYAESTSSAYVIGGESLAARAMAFGMPGAVVDGTDYFAVHAALREATEHARSGEGPSVVEMQQIRYYGHFEGDAQTYRPKDEVARYRETRDCIDQFRKYVITKNLLDPGVLDETDNAVALLVDNTYANANAAELPDLDELMAGVYTGEY